MMQRETGIDNELTMQTHSSSQCNCTSIAD